LLAGGQNVLFTAGAMEEEITSQAFYHWTVIVLPALVCWVCQPRLIRISGFFSCSCWFCYVIFFESHAFTTYSCYMALCCGKCQCNGRMSRQVIRTVLALQETATTFPGKKIKT
jgi:hypothetical protein